MKCSTFSIFKLMIFMFSTYTYYNHNILKYNVKISLNIILTKQFQTHLLLYFIVLKKFKFCIQLIVNSIEAFMLS
jgi:hypothetical protein